MASGDGMVHQVHLIVACYSRDYPEQVLITRIKTGDCLKCDVENGEGVQMCLHSSMT